MTDLIFISISLLFYFFFISSFFSSLVIQLSPFAFFLALFLDFLGGSDGDGDVYSESDDFCGDDFCGDDSCGDELVLMILWW